MANLNLHLHLRIKLGHPWGRLPNLRPIVNRPADISENSWPRNHYPFVTTFHARRLPHYHAIGEPIFLTWRLNGSLPTGRTFPSATTAGQAFLIMDRILDNTRQGPRHLRIPEIASMLVDSIHHREAQLRHYELHCYVVMPNHVHLLVTPLIEVSKVTHSLKKFTAREANRILGLTGQAFWQDESYDRQVRNDKEFKSISHYIEMNPVHAGLAASPGEFRWSSGGPIDNRPQV